METIGVYESTYTVEEFRQAGYLGVAPIEQGCVILFSPISNITGKLSAVLMSRHDYNLSLLINGVTLEDLGVIINGYRPTCQASS